MFMSPFNRFFGRRFFSALSSHLGNIHDCFLIRRASRISSKILVLKANIEFLEEDQMQAQAEFYKVNNEFSPSRATTHHNERVIAKLNKLFRAKQIKLLKLECKYRDIVSRLPKITGNPQIVLLPPRPPRSRQ